MKRRRWSSGCVSNPRSFGRRVSSGLSKTKEIAIGDGVAASGLNSDADVFVPYSGFLADKGIALVGGESQNVQCSLGEGM